jgi:hypothetical protein
MGTRLRRGVAVHSVQRNSLSIRIMGSACGRLRNLNSEQEQSGITDAGSSTVCKKDPTVEAR